MATKNIVPRTGSQGQLGTDTKPWKRVVANSGSFEYVTGSVNFVNDVTASKFKGDGSGLTNVNAGGVEFSAINNKNVPISGSWQGALTDGSLTLISGSGTSTGSFGNLYVGGHISASGTVRADAFESLAGGSTIDFKDAISSTGDVTATGGTLGNIRIGVTGDNELDTSSGNLTIDSTGGTTTIDDDLTVSGNSSFSGHVTASGNISGSGTSTGSFGTIRGDGSGLTGITSVTAGAIAGLGAGIVSGSVQINSLINDTIAATIVAEIDDDEIPIAKLAADSISIAGTSTSLGGSITSGTILTGTNVVSASSIASSAQGQLALTTNGVAASAVDLGLQSGDSPTFTGATLSGLTANKIVRTDGSKVIGSADIDDFIAGTTNQITVTDDTDGSITLSLPQNIHTAATPIFAGLTVQGTLTAQNYVVSSSITTMSIALSSGSTVFGNTSDDTHVFTGSLLVSGSISQQSPFTASFGELVVGGTGNSQNYSDFSSSIQTRIASAVAGGVTSVGGGTGISSTGGTTPTIAVDFGDTTFASSISGSFGNQRVGTTNNVLFNHITGSGNISGSGTSTGSFGRVSTATLDLDSIKSNWTNAGNTVADGGTFTTIDINGGTINGITDLAVADGGTGAGTFTDGGVLLGSGTDAITATAVLTDGQLLIGDNSGDPTIGTLTGTTNQITVTNGAGSITLSLPQSIHTDADVEFDSVTLDDLTATRLVATDGSKKLVSSDLNNWVAGTSNQITVTDDADGTITLSTPQNLDTSADVTFDSVTLDDLTASKLSGTDGSKKIVSINLDDFVAGTTNRITVTDDTDGTITLSTPQDIHTSATPTFASLTTTAHVTASGHISGSATSTGSFGRVEVIHTGSFGRIEATHISASKIFVDAESIVIGGVTIGETVASNIQTLDQSVNTTSNVKFNHVTSSANVSSSGEISAGTLKVNGKSVTVESNTTLNQDLTTDASPQFTGIEIGHADDTTLTRVSSGDLQIQTNIIYRAGGTDVPITDGGTGASTATAAATNLGLGTSDNVTFNQVTSSTAKILGNITASAYYGDGSNLTGVSTTPFPFTGSAGIQGTLDVDGSITSSTFRVDGNKSSQFIGIIDNDQNSEGHVLKLATDGTGNGSYLLDMENGTNTMFRARADGRFAFGNSAVGSMGAGTFVVGIDGGHTSDIAISKRLQHLGDSDTFIDFTTNQVDITAGAQSSSFTANGVRITGNVTASGNISGSGTSTGSFGRVSTATLDLDSIKGNWTNAGNTVADLGTITTIDINGGTINGITDLAITDGGTGASTAANARLNLNAGSGIVSGSTIASSAQGQVALTTNSVAASAVDLGLQTGDSPTFAGGTLGNVKVGVTADGEIDTSSGNLTIDSAGGTTTLDDNVVISGNLTVQGTTTQVDSTTVSIGDRIIELNAESAAGDGGLYVRDADGNETGSLLWDVSADRWMGGVKGAEVNLVTISSTDTLSSKGINLANNTVTGTTAEFNTALSDDSFATLTNSVTLTNKTLTSPDIDTPDIDGGTIDNTIIGASTATRGVFTQITASGHISGSATSTGSFGRVEASFLSGNSPLVIDADQTSFSSPVTMSSGFRIDSLTANRVPFATTNGRIVDDSDFTFSTDTLTVTKLGAFQAVGAIDFNSQAMTNVDINSGTITGITDLAVADGGTGAGTFTDGGVLLGSGTSAITATAVLTNGQLLIGDNSGDPTIGTLTGTSNQVTVTNGAGTITLATPQDIHTSAKPTFAQITGSLFNNGFINSTNNALFVDTTNKTVGIGKKAYGSSTTDGAWFSDLAGSNGYVQISVNGTNEVLSLNQNSTGPILLGRNSGTVKFRVAVDGNVTASLGGQFGGVVQGTKIQTSNGGGPQLVNSTPNGTTPSIYPSMGDTNTGIGYGGANGSTADNINLITGGTTGLYIDSSQNVVIPTGNLSVTGNTTLGDASGDTVTINAETIDLANIAAGTDNSVVVYNGSSLVTDEIDSRVWGSTLLDTDGTGTDNELAIFTDSNTVEGSANLTYDGTRLVVVGHVSASEVSSSTYYGDGSNLTGITTTSFPFTGSAGISGSLSLDRQASNSGSTIFDIKGTQGTLFSVVDEMSGSIFTANTIAGISVIEAFSDQRVKLGPVSNRTSIDTNGNVDISGHITASGNISGSGTASFGNVFVDGNILGKSDNTTEIGSTPDNGAIKKLYMVQGGEISFGDTTTSNFFGIAEGTNNSFSDSDTMGIYYRNGLNVYSANNSQRLKMHANGRLGLNTTSDAGYLLDVNGTSRFSGTLEVHGGNISGSGTSTGSFGRVSTATLDLDSIKGNWTNAGNTVADLGTITTADINGGTIDGITSLTAGGDLDIGSHDLRAATLTADGLTSGRVVFAGTNGVLSDDSDFSFSTDTLTVTKLGAYEQAGAVDFSDEAMTNVNIDSGVIDNTVIGGNTAVAGTFTTVTTSGKVSGSSTGSFTNLHVGYGVGGNLDSDFGSSIAVFRTAANQGIAIDPANQTIKGVSDGGGYALKLSGNIVYLQDGTTTHVEVGSTHSQIPGDERTAFYKPIHLDPSNAVTAGEPAFLIGSGPPMNTGALAFGADNIKIYRSNNSLRIESYNGIGLYGSADTLTATVNSSGINVVGAVTASGDFRANGNIVGDGSTNITGINDVTLSGNLTVNGTTTSINSTQVDIGDRIIELNAASAAGFGGIHVRDASGNQTGSLVWDVGNNYWVGGLTGSEVRMSTISGTETLTNKTLTTPVISSISNTGTLTLPTSTDTLVGRATTDTLTNKTLTSPDINAGTVDGITSLTTGTVASAVDLKDGGGNTVFTYGTQDLSGDESLEIKIGDVDSATTGTFVSIKPYEEAVDFGGASLTIDGDIIHKGDTDTKIAMTTDQIQFKAGNVNMLTLAESTSDTATFVADTINVGSALVSGSATSTGSFGRVVVGSSGLANSGSNLFEVQGNRGTLFNVTDEMSGSIFSANTVAGLPVIEAFSDQRVIFGKSSDPITVKESSNSETFLSGSAQSTASFGRVQASVIGGNSPLEVHASNFTIDANGTFSGSAQATASFGVLQGKLEGSKVVISVPSIRSSRFRGRSPVHIDAGTSDDGVASSAGDDYIVSSGSYFKMTGPTGGSSTTYLNVLGSVSASTGMYAANHINLGHATDTTITRVSSGDIAVEGNTVYRAGGTDVPVADGGTGASSFTVKSVIVSDDSSTTSALAPKQMDGSGELLIGGSSGPEVSTLTEGSNVTITNGNGSITIASTNTNQLTTFTLTGDAGSNQTIEQGSTLDIAGGTGITTTVGATDTVTVAVTADSIGDTQLEYNTGQHLTTSSDVQFNDFRADSIGVGMAATSTSGQLDAAGDIIAYSSSDRRWKENLIRIPNPLDKIGKISGYEFDWKELTDEERKTQHSRVGHDVGVVAQEIQEVLPEVVKERDNGYLAVDYEKIVPLLIESIKELKSELDELKKKV